MHIDPEHTAGGHSHEHTHADGTTHTHPHEHPHDHTHDCGQSCDHCQTPCEHTPME